GGSSRPIAPPKHQAICSTVSDRPNADARDSSGRSCWMTASRLILASALQVAPIKATSAAVAIPGSSAASTVAASVVATATVVTWSVPPRCSREPMALPTKPPAPAAAPSTPSSSSWTNGLWSCCSADALTANAANSIRNPVSNRIVPLPHSATSTPTVIGCLPAGLRRMACEFSVAGTSPSVTSTQDGMRIACTVPATQIAAATQAAPGEPAIQLNSDAMAPPTAPAPSPNTVNRALVFDRVISGGTTRGVTADLSTMYDFDSTILPSAAGYSAQLSKFSAMTMHITA